MTEELPVVAPEPEAQNPIGEPTPVAPPPKQSNKTLWIIAAVVAGVICLCTVVCLAVAVPSLIKASEAKAPVTSVLDSFMRDMVARDAKSAYALFSPRAQRQVPITAIEKMMEGNNYLLFEGYKSLTVENLNLTAAVNTNPDVPQGTLAKVSGTVSYEGGFTGTFTGTLEDVNGAWMIDNFNVVVPPDKIKP